MRMCSHLLQHFSPTSVPAHQAKRSAGMQAFAFLSTTFLLLDAVPAFAQNDDAATDTPSGITAGTGQSSRGNGIALSEDGRARLHLTLDAGTGFDTNPYSVPLEANLFAGDFAARLRPAANIEYPGSSLDLKSNFFIDYGFFPGLINPVSQNFLLYNTGADANLLIDKDNQLSWAVGGQFRWVSDPGQATLGSIFNRVNTQVAGGVQYRPNNGTIKLRANYIFNFEKWLDFLPNTVGGDFSLDNMQHTLQLRGDWRFFPKTGLFVDAKAALHVYPFSPINPTSFPVWVNLGVMGQITPKLTGLASIGYANPLTFDDQRFGAPQIETADFFGLVGQVEAQWVAGPTTRLAGGFQRNVNPAALYQYMTDNRFYIRFNQGIGAKFIFKASATYDLIQFGLEQPNADGQNFTDRVAGDRFDARLDANVDLTYYMNDWFSVGLSNNLTWLNSNATINPDFNRGTAVNLSFLGNQTLVLATVRY